MSKRLALSLKISSKHIVCFSTPVPMTESMTHRWGIRYSRDVSHNLEYLQAQVDNIVDYARPGELFLNEPLKQIYYVDSKNVVKTLLQPPSPVAELDYATPLTPDGLLHQVFKLTLEGNISISPVANPQNGQEYIFLIYQDEIGYYSISFNSAYQLSSQIIPGEPLSLKVFKFIYDGTTFIQI